MISVSIYFYQKELQNILAYIDTIDKNFAKYFQIRYDGLAYTDVDEFFKLQIDDCIGFVPMINGKWPNNTIYFTEKTFCIGVEMSYSLLGFTHHELITVEQWKDFENKFYPFLEKIFAELPIKTVYLGEGDVVSGDDSNLLKPEVLKYLHEVYYTENWKMQIKKWWLRLW